MVKVADWVRPSLPDVASECGQARSCASHNTLPNSRPDTDACHPVVPHRLADHYENLYGVVRGTKIFTLLPPCDVYRMYLVRCPAATYVPYREVAAAHQASCTAQQGTAAAVPYGRVSPEPGRAPVQGGEAAGEAGGVQGGGSSSGGGGGSSGCREEELVAVLKVRAPIHSRCLSCLHPLP